MFVKMFFLLLAKWIFKTSSQDATLLISKRSAQVYYNKLLQNSSMFLRHRGVPKNFTLLPTYNRHINYFLNQICFLTPFVMVTISKIWKVFWLHTNKIVRCIKVESKLVSFAHSDILRCISTQLYFKIDLRWKHVSKNACNNVHHTRRHL